MILFLVRFLRSHQAADWAGHVVHRQCQAVCPGRGRQAAGGGQLPGADKVRTVQHRLLLEFKTQFVNWPIYVLSLFLSWIFSSLPVNKQMLALSATYPESLAQHLTRYMNEPTFVRLNPSDMGLKGKTLLTVKIRFWRLKSSVDFEMRMICCLLRSEAVLQAAPVPSAASQSLWGEGAAPTRAVQ